jgi:PAS domain S-box-containing protein
VGVPSNDAFAPGASVTEHADPEGDRVLVLAPAGRDTAVIALMLDKVGVGVEVCSDLAALVRALEAQTASAAIVAQEALLTVDKRGLAHWIESQPPWSDFPFVLLAFRNRGYRGDTQLVSLLAVLLGNVTVLERPLHPVTLVSAVRAAFRARRRQREAEAFLVERERATAAVHESEAKFRAIAEGMPQAVWSTRADGVHDYFNARWEAVTGVSPLEGAHGWMQLVHPDDRKSAASDWQQALDSGEPYHAEFRLRALAGGHRWFACRALPVRDERNGRIIRWFGSCTDIHDSVLARETLAKSREDLELVVAERTAWLQREMLEREKAEAALAQAQKMEAVGQLTGGVAHDFNNLLTAVLASVEMITQRTSDERVLRFAANARHAAERGARLTQQLLAFSRRQRLAPEPVDINRLVAGMQDLLQRTLGATIQIEIRLCDAVPPGFADPTQVELVVLNLAINARDAMPGGGMLTVGTASLPSVPAKLRDELADGAYVVITVADTGTGMSPQVQARAFEPFFTTKDLGKGTGLGLSQVYGFAKQSGGTVRLHSVPDKGTTVRVYLPRADAVPVQALDDAPETQTGASERATIFVVDDDSDVRELVVMMLDELGYRVIAAEDGRMALEVMDRGEDFDLLLADVAMPGLSGVDVARAARERRGQVPVLFATGYPDLRAFHDGLEGEDMIHKPYRMTDLAARVERALRNAPRRHVASRR